MATFLDPSFVPPSTHKRRYRPDQRLLKKSLDCSAFLSQMVKLPHATDLNEWIAEHVTDFHSSLHVLALVVIDPTSVVMDGTVAEGEGFEVLNIVQQPALFPGGILEGPLVMQEGAQGGGGVTSATCATIPSSCPNMENVESTEQMVSPPLHSSQYIDSILSSIDILINDPVAFPSSAGVQQHQQQQHPQHHQRPYPPDFQQTCKEIFRLFCHCFSVLYTKPNYAQMEEREAVAHLNTTFKHFLFFSLEFNLVPQAELNEVQKLIEQYCDDDEGDGLKEEARGKRRPLPF